MKIDNNYYIIINMEKGLATLAKGLGLYAFHDMVHEMCKDKARHGKAFKRLLDRNLK